MTAGLGFECTSSAITALKLAGQVELEPPTSKPHKAFLS